MKNILVKSDGYSIDYSTHETMEDAQKVMRDAYDELHPEDNAPEWEDMSGCYDTEATLYANGENVYVWRIITV